MILRSLFLFFFFSLGYLVSRIGLLTSTFGGALAFHSLFALVGSLSPQFLRCPVASNVRNRLNLLLLGQLFSFLLLLLDFETFGSCLELLLIDDEEMAGSALGEVRLSQNVLHSRDGAHLALVVDVLELMHLVWLVDDPISLLKVNEFVILGILLLCKGILAWSAGS